MHPPDSIPDHARGLIALTLVKGMGPVRIARILEAFGSFDRVRGASASELERVPGIGSKTAVTILNGLKDADALVARELERVASAGASILTIDDPGYPPLLRAIPAAPPVLCVRGSLHPEGRDRYPVAMVGSRRCTHYGIEQATRFSGDLAQQGLTIVSGGARGIDTSAHSSAIDRGGRTIAVLGCGIAKVYPPENAALFDRIADGNGAVISELPADTGPNAENFPARNRIISGLALGTIVVEAGRKSGALITAKHASEDHGREVMGVPGRVDSDASRGTLDLLRDGAHLVTEPGDVIAVLESNARHLHAGVLEHQTPPPSRVEPSEAPAAQPADVLAPIALTETQGRLVEQLAEPKSVDELADATGIEPGSMRAELTMLELQGRIRRAGTRFVRAR